MAAAPRGQSRASLSAPEVEDGTDRVDLVVLNDAPPELGRHVVQTGRRVMRTDPELDHAYVRDVQLRAADLDVFLRRWP